MLTKLEVAVLVAAIALVSTTLTASHGHRNSIDTLKSAQYCMPDNNLPSSQSRFYC
jgi:hypothetical protein